MSRLVLCMLVIECFCLQSSPIRAQNNSTQVPADHQKEFQQNGSKYFPPGTFKTPDGSPDDHYGDSFAWYLRSIDEPFLPASSTDSSAAESYRLTLIGFPAATIVVVRLQISKDGTGRLFVKQAHFGKSNLDLKTEDSISIDAVNGFLECLKQGDFWQLPTRDYPEPDVKDGTYWYLEGERDGRYHMVYRRIPEANPNRFTDIGRYLTKSLARLDLQIPRSDRSKPARRDANGQPLN